ncbi:MAG: aldehyde dehydrogenase family protein [Peptococcaceae bacterium]
MKNMYINGRCVEGQGAPIDVINPATGKIITTIRAASEEQAEEALRAAKASFKSWSCASINERVGWMNKLKEACLAEREEFVDILAQEGGKSYSEAGSDFDSFIGYLGYYGEEVKRVYDTGLPEYGGHRDTFHIVMKRPLGVVVGHLAWNMPMSNVGLKLSPSLASGCTCVLKPSTSTPLASLKVGEIAERIGVPAGIFNMVTGPAGIIGKYLNASKIPQLISLIGSSAVGIEVMNQAATSIKRFSFELGGNAPAIIMPDADLEKTIKFVAARKVRISGQGCANINRIFIHESIHDQFVEQLVEQVKDIPVGWGKDMPNAMGPMIDMKARNRMLDLVKDSVARGAKLLCGGIIPELPEQLKEGSFFTPAVLDKVTDDMPIANQEIFGPIYAILTFNDLDDVIARSNNTTYGLSAYVFSHDARVMGRCAEELEFGEIQVNMPGAGPNMPHIGIKESGIGCDRGLWSLDEYFNIRRFSVKP